jgi:hypothetical protein
MRVWILVMDEAWEGRDVISVHATEEGAKTALRERMVGSRLRYDIDEWEVLD